MRVFLGLDQFGRRWAASKQYTFIPVETRWTLDVTDALRRTFCLPIWYSVLKVSSKTYIGFLIHGLLLLDQNPSKAFCRRAFYANQRFVLFI